MKFWIPSIGDRVKLSKSWEFALFSDYRNKGFAERHRPDVKLNYSYYDLESILMTLPAGSVLRIDRIYIRKGKKDYDSITFTVEEMPSFTPLEGDARKLFGARRGFGHFWAKLTDVNQMECSVYVPEPKVVKPRATKKKVSK